jgi:hypothetical protein
MIKKKIVLLLLGGLLYLPFSASAQNDFPRHEVAVSLGYIPLYGMEEEPDWTYVDTPLGLYESNKYYEGPEHYLPSISLSYHYNLKKWLSLGAYLSYSGSYANLNRCVDDKKETSYWNNYFAVMTSVRFNFLSKPMVRLYGECGIGVYYSRHKDSWWSKYSTDSSLCGQLTFFGVSVGKKLFGFSEVGFGCLGLIRGGIGYRF